MDNIWKPQPAVIFISGKKSPKFYRQTRKSDKGFSNQELLISSYGEPFARKYSTVIFPKRSIGYLDPDRKSGLSTISGADPVPDP
jgi:hypothetical protein